ncbi:MAG: repair exonuclease family protein YhaO [Labilithrix sp.]|nr:repair exonuclease family protein YhaO [Labilithrix sp.]
MRICDVRRVCYSRGVKFVHAADLHIDSPLRGLDRYEGAPAARLRAATRRALENLVALCIDERAAFLLLAGDVFDGSWKDFSTGLFFATQMTRLREANIPVVIVRGNHDAMSAITKSLSLRLPDNVHELSSKKAETFEIAAADTVIHGQSFPQKATTDDLAARYPDAVRGAFNVGLLHTCVEGREGHDRYAPTSLETMRAKGYDYWALGHVHAREVLSEDPWIVFPGNLQGRHAKETGPKGASLVTVEGGTVASVEHRALDVVRWEQVIVDATGASDAIEVVDRARDALQKRGAACPDRLLAARVIVTGTTRASGALRNDADYFVAQLRAAANDALGDGVWLEKILVQTRATFDLAVVREDAGAVGHLARRLATIKDDPAELAALAASFAELEKKLPSELREGEGALVLTDVAMLRAIVEDVEQTLLPRLLESPSRDGAQS